MLSTTSGNIKLLAGSVGVTLAFALAVGVGAVPHLGDHASVRTAAVSVEELAAPAARQPGDAAREAAAALTPVTAVAAGAVPPGPPTTATKPRTTTPPTTRVAVARVTPTTPVAAVAPVPTVPAAPVKVARRIPSAAEVSTVIAELKRQVGGILLLVSPTPAQIAQAGDQVCTAFDSGQTFAQVKATGLSMIPASVTVPPATADWAVRQAVTLYCPGHASKLV